MIENSKLQEYAPVVLRLGVTAVFAWFGASQLFSPESWTSVVPNFFADSLGINPGVIVVINGTFEIIAALLLGTGLFVRVVSLLLSIHLFVISLSFGISAIAIRDYGLSLATLSVALYGKDKLCFRKETEQV